MKRREAREIIEQAVASAFGINPLKKMAGQHMLKEWDADAHPRDSNGQFASGGSGTSPNSSGKYAASTIVGTTTTTGTEIRNVSKHAKQRMRERRVTAADIAKTLASETAKVMSGKAEGTMVYYEKANGCRVVIGEDNGTVITCMWRK